MGDERLWQLDTIDELRELLDPLDRVRGIWLSGSLARGDADRLSDIDLVTVVERGPASEAAGELERVVGEAYDIVLARRTGGERFALLNFVTYDWVRFDISVFTAEAFADDRPAGLRTLLDKDSRDSAPMTGEPEPGTEPGAEPEVGTEPEPAGGEADAAKVEFLLTEFVRVLGLLPVVLHRDDLIGATSGAGLLRLHLISILQYARDNRVVRGALNETSKLTPEGVAALTALPPLETTRESIVALHVACWEAFLAFGPGIAERTGASWPSRLVEGVRERIRRELGITLQG